LAKPDTETRPENGFIFSAKQISGSKCATSSKEAIFLILHYPSLSLSDSVSDVETA